MNSLVNKISQNLKDDGQTVTFSVRISKKAYDQLQETASITGHKPASIARQCLEVSISEYYQYLLTGHE